MITKQLKADTLEVNPGTREVVAVISSDSIDRDGEIVLPKGLQKKNYGGNPVVLYGHDHNALPIGTTRWIKQDGNRLIAKYYVSDKTQFARDVFGLLQDGVLRAHSIGFEVLENGPPTSEEIKSFPGWKDARNVIRKWELLEFSVVSIPCNPDALTLSVAKGYAPETLDFLGKDFQPKPDCWTWIDTPQAPKPEPKKIAIPKPKFCKSWKQREREILNELLQQHNESELLARLKGRA